MSEPSPIAVALNNLLDLCENDDLPDEISPFSALSDEDLGALTSATIGYTIFRKDDPMRALLALVEYFQEHWIDFNSVPRYMKGEIEQPELSPDAITHHHTVQANRAMYLQLQELADLETFERENHEN